MVLYIVCIFSVVHNVANAVGAVSHAASTASFAVIHAHRLVTIFFAFSVSIVVVGSGSLNNASTFCLSFVSLSCMYSLGRAFRTFHAAPTPTLSHHLPNGSTGIVWKTLAPNSCIPPPIFSPRAFALIAAKSMVRKSPIAKKFTINHENRSSDPHRSKFLNSNSEDHPTLNA